ncbi:MAG: penicillin-binding protein 1A [Gammaproteobacteria bacterium]|nr:penicillin-binding protein 1A [Gammaproteobacteria bacterium]
MLRFTFYLLVGVSTALLIIIGGVAWWVLPQLPSTSRLRDVHFQTPLKVYSVDASLIAEFGEKHRTPVKIDDVPKQLKQAFIAAEDDRFYQHPGVDWMAITRAALSLARSQVKRQGGSTITMQVARNFFLTPEKTYSRKLIEIVLAMKIERELTKDEILELYLNKIFLGQRAYGVAAAAQVYFGSPLSELTLAQCALIAGLPKAPSRLNPITNTRAALDRRGYVLERMLYLGYISKTEFDEATLAPLTAKLHGQPVETSAPHLAEMVRSYMLERYGDLAYTRGFRVYTTVSADKQYAATQALRTALASYDRRHGYRGPEAHVDLAKTSKEKWVEFLNPYRVAGDLAPALITAVEDHQIKALDEHDTTISVGWDGLSWARQHVSESQLGPTPRKAADFLAKGDVIRVQWHSPPPSTNSSSGKNAAASWRLAQIPKVEGALVALDSSDGAVLALVGGFDFTLSKFNRVSQAMRQPGSNFKPFIYSAALNNGFTPASFINDAPIVFDTPGLEGAWRPENYSGTYHGPTQLRDALANSRNLVSIRLMREIGVDKTIEHVSRFGFDPKALPHNLSLSLGTSEVTPLQLAAGYAAFSNGGFRISPYFVQRIERGENAIEYVAEPAIACSECESLPMTPLAEPESLDALRAAESSANRNLAPRAVDAQNAWLTYSMLKDVITKGTGRRALELKRSDLAGKTGTTNDLKDAWFTGFNGEVVTTTWVGFDDSTPLGPQETGARAALPMWIDFMRTALNGAALVEAPRPAGLVTVRVSSGGGNRGAIYETFRAQDAPKVSGQNSTRYQPSESKSSAADQLF